MSSAANSRRALIVLFAGAVALTAAGGCATASRRAHLARVDLEGRSAAQLQACAGDPLRVERSGHWEYLTYVSPLRPNQERSTQCVATFVVSNGYVEDLQYQNPSGGLIGKSIAECLPIVDP